MISLPLNQAEKALERGDYSECINILKELTNSNPPSDIESAKIGVLLATAYIGNGENEKAISICRVLIKCSDKEIREKAKQLKPILEAPSLVRPSNWSVKIPSVNVSSKKTLKLVNNIKKNNSRKIHIEYHPPTGSTKDLGTGFSLLVLIVITILIFILN
tara:strand:- start:692 stop:1171 length:480 start_codon:yes stop_codon:yes gene_type:complete